MDRAKDEGKKEREKKKGGKSIWVNNLKTKMIFFYFILIIFYHTNNTVLLTRHPSDCKIKHSLTNIKKQKWEEKKGTQKKHIGEKTS